MSKQGLKRLLMAESVVVGVCLFLIVNELITINNSSNEQSLSSYSFIVSPMLTIVVMLILIRDAFLKLKRSR